MPRTSKPVTVYTQPGCPPCKTAKDFLTQHKVTFTAKDVSSDGIALNELLALNSQSTPTIVVGEKVMIGFRPNELLAWLDEP